MRFSIIRASGVFLLLAIASIFISPAGSAALAKAENCPPRFTDVTAADWFYQPVADLTCKSVINGYEDRTFRPYNAVTRGQVAKMIVLAMGWTLIDPARASFGDVPRGSAFFRYVETAVAKGVISGYGDGTFRQNNLATRGQVAKMVATAAGWTLLDPARSSFGDVPRGSTFFRYVETAVAKGVISGYGDGTFRQGNQATRAQFSAILSKSGATNAPVSRREATATRTAAKATNTAVPTRTTKATNTAAPTRTATRTSVPPTNSATPTRTVAPTNTATLTATAVRTVSAPQTPAPTSAAIYWGAYISGSTYGYQDAPWDSRTIDTFQANAGKNASILHWGQAWYRNGALQNFAPNVLEAVRQRGAIPLIDWASWDSSAGVNQPNFALGRIIDGTYDNYITTWATAAKAWGHPFFLRFNWEMNGNWFPWSEKVNGNSSGQYAQAWRHVHDIFTQVGATNVTWVWLANTEYSGSTALEGLYPGDDYVDWLGIDGYNWGTNPIKPSGWISFNTLFKATYDHLLRLAPGKPIMIGETGASEYGGSKADWVSDALEVQLPTNFPQVKALVWFNWNCGGMDWVIETSSAAQQAFASGISSPYYAANDYANLSAGPVQAP